MLIKFTAKLTPMYEPLRQIPLVTGSVSPIGKNLTFVKADGKTFAAVAGKNRINFINWDSKMEGLTSDYLVIKDPSSNIVDNDNVGKTGQIMQIKYCSTISRSSPILVICTTIGLIIYDWKSLAILLHLPCPKDNNENWSYSKGIASMDDSVFVGWHNGDISQIKVSDNRIHQTSILKEISNSIVDIESSQELLVACGADGTMVSWLPDLALAQKISTEQPISSLVIQNANAICGTVLGQILVYDMKIGTMIAQVDAHVGPIQCLEMAQETNLMLSASEDTTVRVWKTNTKTPSFELDHFDTIHVQDVSIFGAKFMDGRGYVAAFVGFDHSAIFLYSRKKRTV